MEGIALFQGNELLDKELKLFAGDASHTEEHLHEMNQAHTATGRAVTVSRSPSLDNEFAELVQTAKTHIQGVTARPPQPGAGFDEVFAANPVTVVGELHAHQSPRLTIATKLPELAENKGALVLEHLYTNRQEMLDEYLRSPPDAPLPPLLRLTVDFLDREFAQDSKDGAYYSPKQLILDAKRAGVPVYGIDSDAALANSYQTIEKNPSSSVKFGNSGNYPEDPYYYRVLTMNENARAVIAHARESCPGKILVNVGSCHARPYDALDVPDIGNLVGGASVVVSDGEKSTSEIIRAKALPSPSMPQRQSGDFLSITADPKSLKQELAMQKAMQKFRAVPKSTGVSSAHPSGVPPKPKAQDLVTARTK